MFCTKCGRQLPDGSGEVICAACAAANEVFATEPSYSGVSAGQPAASTPSVQAAPTERAPSAAFGTPPPPPPEGKRRKKLLVTVIAASAVVLALIIGGVAMLLSGGSSNFYTAAYDLFDTGDAYTMTALCKNLMTEAAVITRPGTTDIRFSMAQNDSSAQLGLTQTRSGEGVLFQLDFSGEDSGFSIDRGPFALYTLQDQLIFTTENDSSYALLAEDISVFLTELGCPAQTAQTLQEFYIRLLSPAENDAAELGAAFSAILSEIDLKPYISSEKDVLFQNTKCTAFTLSLNYNSLPKLWEQIVGGMENSPVICDYIDSLLNADTAAFSYYMAGVDGAFESTDDFFEALYDFSFALEDIDTFDFTVFADGKKSIGAELLVDAHGDTVTCEYTVETADGETVRLLRAEEDNYELLRIKSVYSGTADDAVEKITVSADGEEITIKLTHASDDGSAEDRLVINYLDYWGDEYTYVFRRHAEGDPADGGFSVRWAFEPDSYADFDEAEIQLTFDPAAGTFAIPQDPAMLFDKTLGANLDVLQDCIADLGLGEFFY